MTAALTSRLGLVLLASASAGFAQPTSFRYFHDDAGELFRVLDSTGTLIEYNYDPGGNIVQVNRTTVAPASLAILNITPLSGTPGQTVTIYGQNFSSIAANDTVQVGGVAATVISASSGALVVQLPAGFSSGQVSVTVGGVTATSGSLAFTPPPSITSITPPYGDIGQSVRGVVVQGANLAGATFSLSGGGTVTTRTSGGAQATVDLVLGQVPGVYTMVATTNSGASSSLQTAGNFFIVYNSPGNNFTSSLFSTFNATGATPFFPAGTNKLDLLFSVFNATGATPFFAPGTNLTQSTFSLFNAAGSAPLYPAGSHLAWQLFSTTNSQAGSPPTQMAIAAAGARQPIAPAAGAQELPAGTRPPLHLVAGQTVELSVQPAVFVHYLEIDAGKASLGASTTGSLRIPLTAPFGVESFSLKAFGYTSFGTILRSLDETVQVDADPGRTIAGQVIDEGGAPLPGALVTWQAQGLAAAYWRFGSALNALPELRGEPSRVSFAGALNHPNPFQIFGVDPMGVGLGENYVARLTGQLQVETAGIYQFEIVAHAGARLAIDGQLVAEAAAPGVDATVATGSLQLAAGAHRIEVLHYESGGAAALQLLWTPPGGVQAVVPPPALTSEAPAAFRVWTGPDGRFVLRVPAALDGVGAKLVSGRGVVQLDQ